RAWRARAGFRRTRCPAGSAPRARPRPLLDKAGRTPPCSPRAAAGLRWCRAFGAQIGKPVATPTAPAAPTPEQDRPSREDPGPLRAAHTPNFPALLRQLGASLLVTTYQAGRLVLVRDEGDHLN